MLKKMIMRIKITQGNNSNLAQFYLNIANNLSLLYFQSNNPFLWKMLISYMTVIAKNGLYFSFLQVFE